MKTLQQHISEKLVINKDYKNDDTVYLYSLIDMVLSYKEYNDVLKMCKNIDIATDIYDMLYYHLDNFTDATYATNAVMKCFPKLPKNINKKNYVCCIKKYKIENSSKYENEINELFKLSKSLNKEFIINNSPVFVLGSTDEVVNMYCIMNNKYIMLFIANEKTEEVYSLMIIKLK